MMKYVWGLFLVLLSSCATIKNESTSKILVEAENDQKVYVNGKLQGKGSLQITLPTTKTHNIEIRDSNRVVRTHKTLRNFNPGLIADPLIMGPVSTISLFFPIGTTIAGVIPGLVDLGSGGGFRFVKTTYGPMEPMDPNSGNSSYQIVDYGPRLTELDVEYEEAQSKLNTSVVIANISSWAGAIAYLNYHNSNSETALLVSQSSGAVAAISIFASIYYIGEVFSIQNEREDILLGFDLDISNHNSFGVSHTTSF